MNSAGQERSLGVQLLVVRPVQVSRSHLGFGKIRVGEVLYKPVISFVGGKVGRVHGPVPMGSMIACVPSITLSN